MTAENGVTNGRIFKWLKAETVIWFITVLVAVSIGYARMASKDEMYTNIEAARADCEQRIEKIMREHKEDQNQDMEEIKAELVRIRQQLEQINRRR